MRTGKIIARVLFVTSIIITVYFIIFNSSINLNWLQKNIEELQSKTKESFITSIIIFFLIRLLFGIVSIPGTGILTIGAGAIFGFWLGSVLVALSVSIGVLISFYLSRYAFREYLNRKFKKYFLKIDKVALEHGAKLLFFLRITELFPSFIINSFFAFTKIKASTYYWVSLIGILPGIIILANAGSQISRIHYPTDLFTPVICISLAAIAIIPLIGSLIMRK